jgi:transposase
MAKGKYEEWLTDDGLTLLKGWARKGYTDEQMAKEMDIGVRTFYEWKAKYPQISQALKKTKDIYDDEVEEALHQKALEGDTTAMIFWLKNRRPLDWRDKRETQLSGAVQTGPDRLVFDYADEKN